MCKYKNLVKAGQLSIKPREMVSGAREGGRGQNAEGLVNHIMEHEFDLTKTFILILYWDMMKAVCGLSPNKCTSAYNSHKDSWEIINIIRRLNKEGLQIPG